MIFRRKTVERITAPAIARAVVADDSTLRLIDPVGAGFDLLREMDLGHALLRANESADLAESPMGQIIIVAAYTPEDITQARPLMSRFMTIILGMGLGPRYGSRALQLGAVGYVDSSDDEGSIRGLFSDAVARVRIRRTRGRSGTALD